MKKTVEQGPPSAILDFRQRPKFEIKIAGTGGQGIILAGNILGAAAMNANFSAIQMQSYGAAARGSNVLSDVIIQRSGVVNFPVVKKIDLLVAFSQQNFDDLVRKVKPNGLILVDEDLVEEPSAKVPVLRLPATAIAQKEFQTKVVANLVMLGGISHILGFIPLQAMQEAIRDAVPEHFCALNLNAFNAGEERARDAFSKLNIKVPTRKSQDLDPPE